MYEVYLERAAERDLKKLPGNVFHRLVARLRKLAQEPRPAGSRKITGAENVWRIRVGDFRVIYEVDDTVRAVRVMRVKHRREAYR